MSYEDHDAGSSEEGEEARSRHDAGATPDDADDSATSADVGSGNSEECGGNGSDGSKRLDAASEEIAAVEEVLEGEIDDDQLVNRVERSIKTSQSWKAPLPPPESLAAYERVLPGAADRVFRLAERTVGIQESRAAVIRTAVNGEVMVQTTLAEADRDALKRGQWLAAGISTLVSILSVVGMFATPWAAVGFAVPLAQIASSLVRTVSDGGRPRSQMRQESQDPAEPDEEQPAAG